MISTNLSPIVVFVFNRPDHTQRMLDSLAQNKLVDKSKIYFFCDGPRNQDDVEKIQETREICRSFTAARETVLIEREKNLGLGPSVIEGVSKTIKKHGKVIVLEDDLELSPYFLEFMNDALSLYQDDEDVFHVSGYWFPVKDSHKLPDTFFYNTASCWGWGTWERSWSHFTETNPKLLYKKIKEKDPYFKNFNFLGFGDFEQQLIANIEGRINTWAVKWYATIFLNDGHSLHPSHSFVNNLGHDGSGENCNDSEMYHWKNLSSKFDLKKIKIQESSLSRDLMINFYKNQHKGLKGFIKKIVPLQVTRLIKNFKLKY